MVITRRIHINHAELKFKVQFKISIFCSRIQTNTIFLLCCFAKAGQNDASGRKALLRECVCVCGWMSGLFPWLHLQHPMNTLTGTKCGPRQKTIEKDGFTISYIDTTYKRKHKRKQIVMLLFPFFCLIFLCRANFFRCIP